MVTCNLADNLEVTSGLSWGDIMNYVDTVPSGKHTKNYGKSPFLMGNSTISMVIFNSYVKLPEGNWVYKPLVRN